MEIYKIFFENLSLINKKYDLINSRNENFNLFSILRNEWDEVNLHSKFITELFRNKNYGNIFIKLFLEKIEIEVKDFDSINVQVFLEYYVKKGGRIDILLKLSSGNFKKAIIIENKIFAGDQEEQLGRYYFSLEEEKYSKDEIEIVYLNLDGSEPSENSKGGLENDVKEKIKIISYKNEIIEWIGECTKEVARVPIIRETLVQYESLLKKLTSKEEENLTTEIKEFILSKSEYLSVIYSLQGALEEIKKDLQFKFWKKLEEKLNEIVLKKGLILEKNLVYPNCHYSEDLVKKYYIPLI